MSLLKKEYLSIPKSALLSKDIDSIFDGYCVEFLKNNETANEFVRMFLNIIRDFLEKKIDEKTLSTIIHKSLFDDRIKKYHYEPHLWSINDILALIHELLDITWTMGSSNYKNYLEVIRQRHAELVKKYQGVV